MLTRLHRLLRDPLAGLLHMPPCMDTITSTGTAIGASLAATTIAGGDAFQFKNTNNNGPLWMLNVWAKNQAAGEVRIRSPKMHDNVDNIRARVQSGLVFPLFPMGLAQRCYPQDILVRRCTRSLIHCS